MKNKGNKSRRIFLKQSSFGLGAGIVGASFSSFLSAKSGSTFKSPGVISVATIDLLGLWKDSTIESRIKNVLGRMEELSGLKPDIICLPELFSTMYILEKISPDEVAEDEKIPGLVTGRIAEFAGKYKCYVVCPVYTRNNGHIYNSSALIDRKGQIAGVYHKTHPSMVEMLANGTSGRGITPGILNQPVIQTDFGRVGMQIGYDAYWKDGWDNIKNQGADIILFSSDFPGGKMLNHYALQNSCYIISSTAGDARIIDISGNDLHASSTFIRYGWDNINLEKVIIDSWPTNEILPDIFNKYGDKLNFRIWDNNWTATVESRDPEIKIQDVFKDFKITPTEELIERTEEVQKKYRL